MKLLSFLALTLLLWSCSDERESIDTGSDAIAVTSAEVQIRDLSDTFTVSSEVVAYRRSYVAARISGLVEEVRFEEGQQVNRGDILAEMDVRQQKIDLRRAQTTMNEARDNYDRNQVLFESNAISRAEYLSSKRTLDQAKSDVEQLELQIEFGTVRAPITGTVTTRLVEPGNNVSVNERMFTVTDMDLLVVRPGISELNMPGLEEGQDVEITLDVYSDQIINGSIRRIFPSVNARSGLFTVEVEIHQKENQPIIRPGYLARIQFADDRRGDAMTLPTEAISEQDGEMYLFVLNVPQDSVSRVSVSTGIRRDGYVEILDGVQPGDKVVASNIENLEDAAGVRVVGSFRRYGFSN